ncbi:MAG: hypothetical protein LH630_00860, partial [Actinomycetia bacterium]|nr:hypothetical protein [Actinomycetes bacterium]
SMSGTLGTTSARGAGAVALAAAGSLLQLSRSVRRQAGLTLRRGGLPVPVAVPVAVALTVAVVWATTALAGGWVSP